MILTGTTSCLVAAGGTVRRPCVASCAGRAALLCVFGAGPMARAVHLLLLTLGSGPASAACASERAAGAAGRIGPRGGDVVVDCAAAAHVAHAAQQMCASAPIEQALRSVHVRPRSVEEVAQILARLGFRDTLDLQLLGQAGGPEREELMDELKASSLSIADRAKIRLLLGSSTPPAQPLAHSSAPQAVPSRAKGTLADGDSFGAHSSGSAGSKSGQRDADDVQHRSLQGSDGQGMSMDTIAIMVSVLFATVGYLLQCASHAHFDGHFLVPQLALRAYSSCGMP
eukprot:SAG31_NODE_1024_length_10294_cov_7.215400_14_plen_284_part_00